MEKPPRYVQVQTTRHGRVVYYYQRARGRKIRLPDNPRSNDFMEAVRAAAASGLSVPRPPVERPSFEKSRKRDVGLAVERLVRAAKSRAAKKSVSFDITVDWLLEQVERQEFRCALTSIPFYMKEVSGTRVNPYAPSLDRKRPAEGYTKSNTRLVIFAINAMLHDWGEETFERVVSGYRYAKGVKTRTSIPPLFYKVGEPAKIS